MEQWTVTKAESGMRLLDFLRSKHPHSTSVRSLKKAIEAGAGLINGKVERFASKPVGTGDRISFHTPSGGSEPAAKAPVDFDQARVLYVDEWLLVYDKPAGVPSDSSKFLAALQAHYPSAKLAHRLDRDTTGALVFALSADVNEALEQLFRARQVHKTYCALVDGVPVRSKGVVENYIGKLSVYQGQTLWGAVPPAKGSAAVTRWQVKTRGTAAALVLCYPATGRTHQIRVHLSGLGHPILGDYQYGKSFKCPYRPARMMLHAREVAFEHPVTQRELRVQAPVPPDFIAACNAVLQGGTKTL